LFTFKIIAHFIFVLRISSGVIYLSAADLLAVTVCNVTANQILSDDHDDEDLPAEAVPLSTPADEQLPSVLFHHY